MGSKNLLKNKDSDYFAGLVAGLERTVSCLHHQIKSRLRGTPHLSEELPSPDTAEAGGHLCLPPVPPPPPQQMTKPNAAFSTASAVKQNTNISAPSRLQETVLPALGRFRTQRLSLQQERAPEFPQPSRTRGARAERQVRGSRSWNSAGALAARDDSGLLNATKMTLWSITC